MSDIKGNWFMNSMSYGFHRIQEHGTDFINGTKGLIFNRIPIWTMGGSNLNNSVIINKPLNSYIKMDHDTIVSLLRTLFSMVGCALMSYWLYKLLEDKLDPSIKEKKTALRNARYIMEKVGISMDLELNNHELCVASNIVDSKSLCIHWEDIGGLDEEIQELQENVILPFLRHDLFNKSQLFRAPLGALLYGPPGCGKTMLAKACAYSSNSRFIDLQVSTLTDKWYGESQKLAEAVFTLARKIQPVIIFIDEVDAFLRSRNSHDQETTAMMKAQFMSLWDGLRTDPNNRILIIGATNRPRDVDAAILRRMPAQFYIGPPGERQRLQILRTFLDKENLTSDARDRLAEIAATTEGFSGSDLRELCRCAAITRARSLLRSIGVLSSIKTADADSNTCHSSSDKNPNDESESWSNVQCLTAEMAQLTWSDFETALKKLHETRLLNISFDCCTIGSSIPLD